MKATNGYVGVGALGVAVILCLAFSAVPALASSGEFTRAQANADWTQASIAGSVAMNGCYAPREPTVGFCGMLPYVAVGPGSDPAECNEAERPWPAPNRKIQVVWEGRERSTAGNAEFDLAGIPLSGGTEQLACLVLRETLEAWPYCPEPETLCTAQLRDEVKEVVLDSAVLTVNSVPPEGPEGGPVPPEPPTTEGPNEEIATEESPIGETSGKEAPPETRSTDDPSGSPWSGVSSLERPVSPPKVKRRRTCLRHRARHSKRRVACVQHHHRRYRGSARKLP